MARRSVLILNSYESGAGAEFVYQEMVSRLGADHPVTTVSGGASTRPGHVRLPDRKGRQALWVLLAPLVGALAFWRVLAAVRRARPDVAVVHNLWPNLGLGALAALALAKRLQGTRLVLVAHDFQYVCATSMLYDFGAGVPCTRCLGGRGKAAPLVRSCDKGGRAATLAKAVRLLLARGWLAPSKAFDATVAPSATLAEVFRSDGFASVAVVPNGLQQVPRVPGRRSDVVLFAGRLEPEKGADVLPDVGEALAARSPGSRLVVLGDGSLRASLAAECARRGLSGTVAFAGRVDRGEVLRHAAEARVFLFPSRWIENCPLSLAEAVASGLVPVVGEGCRGAIELLDRLGAPHLRVAVEGKAMAEACIAALAMEPVEPAVAAVSAVHDATRAGVATDAIVFGDGVDESDRRDDPVLGSVAPAPADGPGPTDGSMPDPRPAKAIGGLG